MYFEGYPHGKKGWEVYDLAIVDVFTSRDVIYNETCFPFANNIEGNPGPSDIAQPNTHSDCWLTKIDFDDAHYSQPFRLNKPNSLYNPIHRN